MASGTSVNSLLQPVVVSCKRVLRARIDFAETKVECAETVHKLQTSFSKTISPTT